MHIYSKYGFIFCTDTEKLKATSQFSDKETTILFFAYLNMQIRFLIK